MKIRAAQAPTAHDDGDQDTGGPGSPGSYTIEPIPEGQEQIVYPKYEEAFRLGLQAFSKTRTNKFRRQLPHILGTLEFQSDLPPRLRNMETYQPGSVHQSQNENAAVLDSPGIEATVGTGSSDFAKMAQDVIESFQLSGRRHQDGSPASGEGVGPVPSMSSGSVALVAGSSPKESDSDMEEGIGLRSDSHPVGAEVTACIQDRELEHEKGQSPKVGDMAHHVVDSEALDHVHESASPSLSETGVWHSVSSGGDDCSPSADFAGDLASGSVGIQMHVEPWQGVSAQAAMSNQVSCKTASLATSDQASTVKGQCRTDGATPCGEESMDDAGSLSVRGPETSQASTLTGSLSVVLDEGLFDDDDLCAELENLRDSGPPLHRKQEKQPQSAMSAMLEHSDQVQVVAQGIV
eukprot:evm.model.scf_2044.1 EVM.evm.TU.scf_2044.1   scf_2044:9250-11073(-)